MWFCPTGTPTCILLLKWLLHWKSLNNCTQVKRLFFLTKFCFINQWLPWSCCSHCWIHFAALFWTLLHSGADVFHISNFKWIEYLNKVLIVYDKNSTWIAKHRKNCECCHHQSVFKGHNVIVHIVVLNCQKCNQCLKCQVSGHKNFQKIWKLSKHLKHSKNLNTSKIWKLLRNLEISENLKKLHKSENCSKLCKILNCVKCTNLCKLCKIMWNVQNVQS